jgi:hypothetical protein
MVAEAVAASKAAAPAPAPAPAPIAKVEVVQEVPAKAVQVAAAPVAPAHTPTIAGTNLSPVVRPAAGAVTERRNHSYGDDSDNVGVGDIIMPRLNIVQKVGDLSNQFTEGDIVFNKESVLLKSPKGQAPGTGPCLRIVVAGFRVDRYAEKTVGGAKGDIVDTEAEVYAKGATTDYNEAKATGKKLYQTLAECLILIEKPEGIDDPSFKYFIDGKAYAPALWTQKGTSFTNATKILRTARKAGWLSDEYNPDGTVKVKRSYSSGYWEVRTLLKDYFGNWSWIPVLRRGEYTSPAIQELAAKMIG